MDYTRTYQIQSTPFMRRLISKSKKNGELQRLKQEYERIKGFGERMMEMRMRQMRLKRLHRVIEMINQEPQRVQPKRKSYEQYRAEQILKARQLGQEYSRQNAISMDQNPIRRLNFRNLEEVEKEEKRRMNTLKRINYGNQCSKSNLETLANSTIRHTVVPKVTESADAIERKRQSFLKRIKYGNECSHINLENLQRVKQQLEVQNSYMGQLHWLHSLKTQTTTEEFVDAEEELSSMLNEPPTAEISQSSPNDEPIAPYEEAMDVINTSESEQQCVENVESEHGHTLEASLVKMENSSTSKQLTEDLEDSTLLPTEENQISNTKNIIPKTFEHLPNSVCINVIDQETQNGPNEVLEPSSYSRRLLEHVRLEDLTEDNDNSEICLHFARNPTILYSTDITNSESAFELPSSSICEHLTSDQLVMSCQRYIDNIRKDNDEMSLASTSKYDSRALNPMSKILNLRSKLRESENTTCINDKVESLMTQKALDLRKVFQH